MADLEAVFERELGQPLGLSAMEAAAAVIRVANARMAGAIRMVSVSLGHDPRDFALFAFGGAGPLHATALARELSVPKVLVPARPGITNALGCAVADLRHDFVNSILKPLDQVDMDALHQMFSSQISKGRALIEQETVAVDDLREVLSVDMQFVGQTHVLRVPLETSTPSRDMLQNLFATAYFERFQVELPEIRPAVVSVNTSIIGRRPEIDLSVLLDPKSRRDTIDQAQTGTRKVWFESGWTQTPIYWRDHLPLDAMIQGPAIVEQLDTTTVIRAAFS